MKMIGTIAGYSATGRKKFMARQWAALIVFCGVETVGIRLERTNPTEEYFVIRLKKF